MKPKSPEPPDPKETSAASTATNVGTAIANAWMGNVSENTPDGSTTVSQTGTQTWDDPYTSKSYDIPTFTRDTTLSQNQQAIKTQQDQASLELSTTGNQQAGFLKDYLSKPVQTGNIPGRVDSVKLGKYGTSYGSPDSYSSVSDYGSVDGYGSVDSYKSVDDYGSVDSYKGADDFSADRKRVEDALFARLNPQFDKDRETLASRLANQGIKAGSRAYSSENEDFNQKVNDARMGVVLAGGQEQSRLVNLERDAAVFGNDERFRSTAFGNEANRTLTEFGNDERRTSTEFGNDERFRSAAFGNEANRSLTEFGNNERYKSEAFNNQVRMQEANFGNDARASSLKELFALRNQPINEISALMSGGQVSAPQFYGSSMPTIPTTDTAGLINTNFDQQMGVYNQKVAQSNQMMGGLGGLFSSMIGLSDKRAKKNIKKVGKLDGHSLYRYNYKGEAKGAPKQTGVMAQEVEKTRPDAVLMGSDGLRRVNYGALFGAEAA